jgi:hypothetical protein
MKFHGPQQLGRRALWTIVAGVVLFLRYPDWILRPRLWAEDGLVFFLDAQRHGAAAFLSPYAGYFHLIPRTIAWVAGLFDPSHVPSIYVYSSFGLILWVVAFVLSPRINLPNKPLLALAIVAVPHAGEVFLNPTNIQWITALALLLLSLASDPNDYWDWTADTAVILFAGLTGPFSILLLPFFFIRAITRATKASWRVLLLAAFVASIQGSQVYYHTPAPMEGFSRSPLAIHNLTVVLATRIPLAILGSQDWVNRVSENLVFAAGLASLIAVVWLAFIADQYRRQRIAILLFLILTAGAAVERVRPDLWGNWGMIINGDRYFYIPRVMFLWIVFVSIDRTGWSSKLAVLLIGSGVLFSLLFPKYSERPYFPWDIYCENIRSGKEVEIEVSPGWRFTLPARGERGP